MFSIPNVLYFTQCFNISFSSNQWSDPDTDPAKNWDPDDLVSE